MVLEAPWQTKTQHLHQVFYDLMHQIDFVILVLFVYPGDGLHNGCIGQCYSFMVIIAPLERQLPA